MRLIKPSVEILEQAPGLQGIYDMIELCGKTSYKSLVKGGEEAKKFVEARINEGHLAVLEFGTVYLKVPAEFSPDEWWLFELANNKYTQTFWQPSFNYITTNFRVLVENNWTEALKYLCEPTEFHVKRYAARIITDRSVSHELVRHKLFCVA